MAAVVVQERMEMLPVAALVPYARNSRTHSDQQVAQIAASMREFGFTNPVLVDEAGGIIAGHGRVMAAKSLGLVEVPCIRLAHLSEAQKRAYVIADNKLALNAGWDDAMLRLELEDLRAADFDLDLLGFNAEELGALLTEPEPETEGLTDPDKAPEPPAQPVTVEGDVWLLGKHRVMCGDSTRVDSVQALLAGKLAEMVFTDPPYGVNVKGGKSSGNEKMRIVGDLTQTAIPFSFDLAVQQATTEDARFYFCGGEGNIGMYGKLFDRYLGQLPRHLIWVKNGFTLKPNGYHNQYEIIFYGYKSGGGGLNKWYGERTEDAASDVWRISRDPSSTYEHPTQKPVALPLRAIENSSAPGGIVYEPFGGSGSTLLACEQSGRICKAMELDPRYCDVIVKRWQAFTGRQATLEATGQTFAEVEAQRA